jgi:hypothetical protein
MDGDLSSSRSSRRHHQQRRRTIVIATVVAATLAVGAAVAVALVVTREDDPAATKVGPRSRGTTTSSTTTTSTLPVVTTAVPASSDPVVALAQQYDGRYVGTFTNSTFNTTGPATLELTIDPVTSDLTIAADFDGDLFGGDAKAVRRISGTVRISDPNAALTTQTDAFGPVTGRIDESLQLILTADDVPGRKVKSFTLTGRLRDDLTGFDASFAVVFEDGSTAEGTVVVTCDPAGSRTNEVTTICALTGATAPAP